MCVRQVVPIAYGQLLVFCDGAETLQSHKTLLGEGVVVGLNDAVRSPAMVYHVEKGHDHANCIWVSHFSLVLIVEDKSTRGHGAETPKEFFFAQRGCLFLAKVGIGRARIQHHGPVDGFVVIASHFVVIAQNF